MAAPGYPQMGQMPPGMGGPMGAPMGAVPQMRPIRRGTSKAVPVVVSAGLAVGVFCGLLFGVGTGKDAAVAAPSASNVKKTTEEEAKPEPGAAPKGLGATPAQPPPPKAGSGAGSGSAVAVAAAGSAAVPATGSGSAAGSAAPAVEEKKVIKLTFKLKPDSAEKDAKITIDGKALTGLSGELAGDAKKFKVVVKADGFRTLEKSIDVVSQPGDELQIELELQKRPSGGNVVRPPRRPERPTNAGGNGGGLIDI